MSQFGNFYNFCRDSTLPVCNLFPFDLSQKQCVLQGFVAGGNRVGNVGSMIVSALAVLAVIVLLWRSERKKAAVGRREIQVLLVFYALVSICEIVSIGNFKVDRKILIWFSGIHIGAITATCWLLLINSIVGYQLIDDGTPLSVGMTLGSAIAFLVGVSYIALDTGFGSPSGEFTIDKTTLKHYPLYVLYLLFPLLLVVAFFILESVLVLTILRETRPMILLTLSVLLFAIGQIFQFVISIHLCKATDGKIDGAVFESLFTLLAMVCVWFFWSSITEDEWPEDPLNPTMTEPSYA